VGWFASQLLYQRTLHAQQAGDSLKEVHGNADGASLLGDVAADRLANTPGGVCLN
jgi:hypothetical protein